MKFTNIGLGCTFLLTACCTSFSLGGLYDSPADLELIHRLTTSNFDAFVLNDFSAGIPKVHDGEPSLKPLQPNQRKPTFVEFYAAWCGHCQRFAPCWRTFASGVQSWSDFISVGAIDCSADENTEKCSQHNISRFPTIKLFPSTHMVGMEDPAAVDNQGRNHEQIPQHMRKLIAVHLRDVERIPLLQATTSVQGVLDIVSRAKVPSSHRRHVIFLEPINSTLSAQILLDSDVHRAFARGREFNTLQLHVIRHDAYAPNASSASAHHSADYSTCIKLRATLGAAEASFAVIIYDEGTGDSVVAASATDPVAMETNATVTGLVQAVRVHLTGSGARDVAVAVDQRSDTPSAPVDTSTKRRNSPSDVLNMRRPRSPVAEHRRRPIDVRGADLRDILAAVDHALHNEIALRSEIADADLATLRNFVRILAQQLAPPVSVARALGQLPSDMHANASNDNGSDAVQSHLPTVDLQALDAFLEGKMYPVGQTLSGTEWKTQVTRSAAPSVRPPTWVLCKGSSPQLRGYPCGLWTLFHSLVSVATVSRTASEEVFDVVIEYVRVFFGCAGCSDHFLAAAANWRHRLVPRKTFGAAVLYLWLAHNKANIRLGSAKDDPTNDPEHPKLAFPLASQCASCRVASSVHDNGSIITHWNITATLNYLLWYHGITVRMQTARGPFHPRTLKLLRYDLSTLDAQATVLTESTPEGKFEIIGTTGISIFSQMQRALERQRLHKNADVPTDPDSYRDGGARAEARGSDGGGGGGGWGGIVLVVLLNLLGMVLCAACFNVGHRRAPLAVRNAITRNSHALFPHLARKRQSPQRHYHGNGSGYQKTTDSTYLPRHHTPAASSWK
eukprot:m.932141 g.932141  ORF g.932141 m.932141 type:complete len:845 (-) comp23787_c1_seq2:140-2674(-)